MTSTPASLFPLAQRPPMNNPNAPSCRAIHSSAGLSLSGAGPYAIVSKISETVVMSYHGMVMRRGIAPGHKVLELALDVGEDRKSTRLNSSHSQISYAVFCLKKKTH